ncbi:heme biosynthesis protein HemY [Desulfovibrio sp. PG-178-WT-4]|uniref:Heme biosynthesis protein HemY n=1 Tax=Desulfovibrio porci TaxID=2605782 RepID=A0A6L5XK61_9BACT|nr:IscA/HesB family protein [Desulfovibrio porci]MDY3810148.1 IscA/HesB family protein [Desulfovibrio porci]MSS27547.1 heme biosynthesis protein HemY [Desulfovibrio porci]
MLELTESARKELESYFTGKEKGAIRIYLAPGGCCGPRLALALDAATDDDQSEEQAGFTFCINKELLAQVHGVKIDLSHMGFTVEPTMPLPENDGGGCGSCCGGCGSH